MTQDLVHRLQERIKELTALHQTARILQAIEESPKRVIEKIVALLPAAWQYPEATEARIEFREWTEARIEFREWTEATPNYTTTPWRQCANFVVGEGGTGSIEIVYTEEFPAADEGPFLKEERDLIDSLAEMLRSYFQHLIADEELQKAHSSLEQLVSERTKELACANRLLSEQVRGYADAQKRIERYQLQLRQLASQLAVVEARERRAIAIDLHDHIGQTLAFIKMHIARFQGNAMFCGFEVEISEILSLLNQTIQYTRDLTSQISPPVLYELGLSAALRWLADNYQQKYKISVRVDAPTQHRRTPDEINATVFKAIQELLTNVVKHAAATEVIITVIFSDCDLTVEIADNGRGFEVNPSGSATSEGDHFGLFSIREQISYLGGTVIIVSSLDQGTRVTLKAPY
jgi:signal transduction histidine kinase